MSPAFHLRAGARAKRRGISRSLQELAAVGPYGGAVQLAVGMEHHGVVEGAAVRRVRVGSTNPPKLEGDPVDILANDTLIAKGQVVVQDEKYGIRVTEITRRIERIKSLS